MPRAIFFGTPELAVPSLEALATVAEIVLVVTQPDRPQGRGMKLAPPPVKVRALELGLPVEQPVKVRTGELADRLRALEADIALVIAYGRILPLGVLTAPRLGCVNVHASILPAYRGAAPIQWAVANGDRETGMCLMQMDEGMDTGDVLSCAKLAIEPNETAGDLAARLSRLGAELVARDMPRVLRGELPRTPQDHARATTAPMLEKEDGRIRYDASAQSVHDRARGMTPWPGAFTFLGADRVKVHGTRVLSSEPVAAAPGEVLAVSADGLDVACLPGVVRFLELQLEGKKRMPARDVANARSIAKGARFSS